MSNPQGHQLILVAMSQNSVLYPALGKLLDNDKSCSWKGAMWNQGWSCILHPECLHETHVSHFQQCICVIDLRGQTNSKQDITWLVVSTTCPSQLGGSVWSYYVIVGIPKWSAGEIFRWFMELWSYTLGWSSSPARCEKTSHVGNSLLQPVL